MTFIVLTVKEDALEAASEQTLKSRDSSRVLVLSRDLSGLGCSCRLSI
jgi:hypothetical protein